EWVAVGELFVIFGGWGDVDRRAAALGDGLQGACDARREDDRALLIPTASATVWGIAEGLRRAAGSKDFLQLSVCEESEIFPIRRPEGEDATLSSGEGSGFSGAEAQQVNGALVIAEGHTLLYNRERDLLPVGRNHRRSGHDGSEVQAGQPFDGDMKRLLSRSQAIHID